MSWKPTLWYRDIRQDILRCPNWAKHIIYEKTLATKTFFYSRIQVHTVSVTHHAEMEWVEFYNNFLFCETVNVDGIISLKRFDTTRFLLKISIYFRWLPTSYFAQKPLSNQLSTVQVGMWLELKCCGEAEKTSTVKTVHNA